MTKDGFYRYIQNVLEYAPNKVINKNYVLDKNKKDEYTFPVNDWYWFNSSDEANTFFDIKQNDD